MTWSWSWWKGQWVEMLALVAGGGKRRSGSSRWRSCCRYGGRRRNNQWRGGKCDGTDGGKGWWWLKATVKREKGEKVHGGRKEMKGGLIFSQIWTSKSPHLGHDILIYL